MPEGVSGLHTREDREEKPIQNTCLEGPHIAALAKALPWEAPVEQRNGSDSRRALGVSGEPAPLPGSGCKVERLPIAAKTQRERNLIHSQKKMKNGDEKAAFPGSKSKINPGEPHKVWQPEATACP